MVIRIEQTCDPEYIKSVFTNPEIYHHMTDDASPAPEALDFDAAMQLEGLFIRPWVDDKPAGCIWLLKKGDEVEAHTAILPEFHGKAAVRIGREVVKWVFANTDSKAITSYAWSDAPQVAWFCRAVGMHFTHETPWPTTRKGQVVTIRYFIINRPVN